MTKEEALKQNVPLYFSSDYDGPGEEAEWHTGATLAESIYKSMDQYADQQSIEFAEWMENNTMKYMDGWLLKYGEMGQVRTTTELLTLYKQQL